MKTIWKILLLILATFTGLICIIGIIMSLLVLLDVSFEGKSIVIAIFLLASIGFGTIAFICGKYALQKAAPRPNQKQYAPTPDMFSHIQNTDISSSLTKQEILQPKPVSSVREQTVTIKSSEVPQDILHSMRSAYTSQQAANDIRIINESLEIMEKTSDLDTFFTRYETAMRCALTLEQAKKAETPVTLNDGFSQSVVSAKNKALEGILYRSYQKEVDEISQLKTNSGKLNRINKYQQKLESLYEDEFEFNAEDAYNDIMQKIELLKKAFV